MDHKNHNPCHQDFKMLTYFIYLNCSAKNFLTSLYFMDMFGLKSSARGDEVKERGGVETGKQLLFGYLIKTFLLFGQGKWREEIQSGVD